jgi:hypothetical protein
LNHNGVSEAAELSTLDAIAEIALDYQDSRFTDEYGNVFRFRARVRPSKGNGVNRWAYDVFLKAKRASLW